jgi:hypothetical protein
VVSSIGEHHVVARLRAAVEANDGCCATRAHERIGDDALAGIAEAEIHDNDGAAHQASLPRSAA